MGGGEPPEDYKPPYRLRRVVSYNGLNYSSSKVNNLSRPEAGGLPEYHINRRVEHGGSLICEFRIAKISLSVEQTSFTDRGYIYRSAAIPEQKVKLTLNGGDGRAGHLKHDLQATEVIRGASEGLQTTTASLLCSFWIHL